VGPRVSPDVVGKRQNLLVLPGFEPDSSNMQSVKESYGFYFHPPFFLIIFPHLRLRPCPPPPHFTFVSSLILSVLFLRNSFL